MRPAQPPPPIERFPVVFQLHSLCPRTPNAKTQLRSPEETTRRSRSQEARRKAATPTAEKERRARRNTVTPLTAPSEHRNPWSQITFATWSEFPLQIARNFEDHSRWTDGTDPQAGILIEEPRSRAPDRVSFVRAVAFPFISSGRAQLLRVGHSS